jgi:hypothetical protein
MVYWLGGEWGVFNSSTYVVDRKLSMEERRRHMQTAYRIDILARSGIILLLPLGLHMGYIWGAQPLGGDWLTGMWVLALAWWGLCLAAFFYRNSDTGITLTKIDEGIRFFVIPALMLSAIGTLLGYGPVRHRRRPALVCVQGPAVFVRAGDRAVPAFRDARMAGEVPGAGTGPESKGRGNAGAFASAQQAHRLPVLDHHPVSRLPRRHETVLTADLP